MAGRRYPDPTTCLLLLTLASAAAIVRCAEENTCLILAGETGGTAGNAYCYHTFSNQRVVIAKGDVLEYEMFQPASNPSPSAGLDIDFASGAPLRATACQDKAGKPCHPGTQLPESVGRWLPRQIALTPMAGRSNLQWNVALEGDDKGVYALCLDNVAIAHADGTRTVIYANGPPPVNRPSIRSIYAHNAVLATIPRTSVTNEGLARWLAQERPAIVSQASPVTPLASPAPAPPPPARKVRAKPAAKPQPVPESKLIEEARTLVRDFFSSDYAKAAGGQRETLIARLTKEAAETNTDMDLKYALLDEALTAARQCERFDLALDTIDAVARAFELDGWKLKTEVIRQAAPDSAEEGKTLVACCLEQLETAFDEDRYAEAQAILGIARECATRLKDEHALELLKKHSRELTDRQPLFARYQAAKKALEEKPDDAAAHLAVGVYLCFVKEDLEAGLPHLAAGSDPALKTLASQELAKPAASDARFALADAWFDLAQKPGPGKDVMLERAAEHYTAVLPNLDGEARTKAAQRLAVIRPAPAAEAEPATADGPAAGLAPLIRLSFDKATLFQQGDHLLAKDLSGNAHRVILAGCTSGPGVSGEAVVLDGKQSRVVVVDSGKLDFGGKDFTAAVWFRPDALPAREQMIFEKSAWPQPDTFQITLFSPTTVRFNYPAISPGVNHEIALVPGTWHHYAFVVQAGKTLTLYANGKAVASAPMIKPIGPGSSPIHIGHRRAGLCPFTGAIDEFVLVPRALAAAEVAQRPPPPAPPVARPTPAPKADGP